MVSVTRVDVLQPSAQPSDDLKEKNTEMNVQLKTHAMPHLSTQTTILKSPQQHSTLN